MRAFKKIHSTLQWSKWQYMLVFFLLLILVYVLSALYQVYKPLPKGLNLTGKVHSAKVSFFADQTVQGANGQPQHQSEIFPQILKLISEAQSTIVLDMFLFNADMGDSQGHQPLSQQLTEALLQKKRQQPNMDIVLITDPVNTLYGGVAQEHLHQLSRHGINVIMTRLEPLRASNPVWSGFWYMCCQSLGNNPEAGWLPNPLGKEKITLRSYLALLNFKANHRKTLLVDTPRGWTSLVTSMNPHDASSLHHNVAVVVEGSLATDLLHSEQAVAALSDADMPLLVLPEQHYPNGERVQLLTEQAILKQVLASIGQLNRGDALDIMMFYLSERQIIRAIKAAKQRGVMVRLLLDPNKDAFGKKKNGIPNRPVAAELHKAGIAVRWCNTHGEQCHSKLLIARRHTGQSTLIVGSANYTARNLKNYNLETDVAVYATQQSKAMQSASAYFEQAWTNRYASVSVDYARYQDDSRWHYVLYRFMEWSGLSTF